MAYYRHLTDILTTRQLSADKFFRGSCTFLAITITAKLTHQFQRNRIIKPSTNKLFSRDSEDDRRSECRNVSVEKCKGISFHVFKQLKNRSVNMVATFPPKFSLNITVGMVTYLLFSFNQITSKIRARSGYNFRKQTRLI